MTDQQDIDGPTVENVRALMEAQSPRFTESECIELEAVFSALVQKSTLRRAALESLARSGEELLMRAAREGRSDDHCATLARGAREYADQLRALADLMDSAATRMLVVACCRRQLEEDELAVH